MAEGGIAIVDMPLQKGRSIADSADLAFKDFSTWGEDANAEWVKYYVNHFKVKIRKPDTLF